MDSVKDLGHIGVLMGGYSSEREISLKSGQKVTEALKRAGCQVTAIDITERAIDKISGHIQAAQIDVAFIALHGALGEDGSIQTILEKNAIPYTGSGIKASQLVINKELTQRTLAENNIPIPEFQVISRDKEQSYQHIAEGLQNKSFVVKPVCEGSSFGISLVDNEEDFKAALTQVFRYGPQALIEKYIDGRELTVGILGETPLPIVEIKPKNKFFDFTAKYQKDMTKYIVPAELSGEIEKDVQRLALEVHCILGCKDISRIDLILDHDNKPYCLEANTIPGFTETSLVPMAAKHIGIDFTQLCLKLIYLAYEKTRQKN